MLSSIIFGVIPSSVKPLVYYPDIYSFEYRILSLMYLAITGFLPGIFQGGKIYCYANFFSYANFSVVFGPNFRGV